MASLADLLGGRAIVAVATLISGHSFVVATTNDLFSIDVGKKRVCLLKFKDDAGALRTVEQLVTRPIVALVGHVENHTIYVATMRDLYEVNFVTRRVTLAADFWPAVDHVAGAIPEPQRRGWP